MLHPMQERVSNGGESVRIRPNALKHIGSLGDLAMPNRHLGPQDRDLAPPSGFRVDLDLLVNRSPVCPIEPEILRPGSWLGTARNCYIRLLVFVGFCDLAAKRPRPVIALGAVIESDAFPPSGINESKRIVSGIGVEVPALGIRFVLINERPIRTHKPPQPPRVVSGAEVVQVVPFVAFLLHAREVQPAPRTAPAGVPPVLRRQLLPERRVTV